MIAVEIIDVVRGVIAGLSVGAIVVGAFVIVAFLSSEVLRMVLAHHKRLARRLYRIERKLDELSKPK